MTTIQTSTAATTTVARGPLDHVAALTQIVGPDHVLVQPSDPRYVQDLWGSDRIGVAGVVVRPGTTDEVAQVVAHCHRHGQPLVTQGGMTGLVSAGVPSADELVLSTERLTAVGDVDLTAGTVVCGAGVTLADLERHVDGTGLAVPIQLAPKESATIGGAVATNAGGLNVVAHGMTRQHVRSLTVVLADGTTTVLSTSLMKDNAGYDLKQLFIGSEGTLGVVTEVTLALVTAPRGRQVAFCALRDTDVALRLLSELRLRLPGTLSAFEVVWGEAYDVLTDAEGLDEPPLPFGHPVYALLELDLVDDLALRVVLDDVGDGVLAVEIAHDEQTADRFWHARGQIPRVILGRQPLFGFDVSVTARSLESVLAQMRAELTTTWPQVQMLVFGHLGDDNVHISVVTGESTRERKPEVERIVYQAVAEHGGSISAEHGIGFEKRDFLGWSRTPEEVALMRLLKHSLDPTGVLNRGRVLPWNERNEHE